MEPVIDINAISKNAYKGDEDAQNKLMELGDNAAKSGNNELAAKCYHEAAVAHKFQRFKFKTQHEEAALKLKYANKYISFYEDYCMDCESSLNFDHSFSSFQHCRDMAVQFLNEHGQNHHVAWIFFEDTLQARGFEFSSPGASSKRYFVNAITDRLGFDGSSITGHPSLIEIPAVRVAVNKLVPDFIAWAEAKGWGEE